MVTIFADTSALYALLDRDGSEHVRARDAFEALENDVLVTHRYVVAEASALVRRRLGPTSVADLVDGLLAPMTLLELADDAFDTVLAVYAGSAGTSDLSLVDRLSFEVMRQHAITTAFAFDQDFVTAGFAVVPTPRSEEPRA